MADLEVDFSDLKKFSKQIRKLNKTKAKKLETSISKKIIKFLLKTVARHKVLYSKGLDTEGQRQKSYSPEYQEAIKKNQVRGRGIRKPPSRFNARDLLITGDFLRSIRVQKENLLSSIAFFPPSQHYSGQSMFDLAGHLRKRGFRFHVFSKRDEKEVLKLGSNILLEMEKEIS